MSKVVHFEPRSALDAKKNLAEFIAHCRNNLALYQDQGGFAANAWHFEKGGRRIAITFSKYNPKNNPYGFEPLDAPFLGFAQAYIRYTQSLREVTSVGDKLVSLRTMHDALQEVYGRADVLNLDGLVQSKIQDLLNERYPGSDKLFRYGNSLNQLYKFLTEKAITPTLPRWTNPWKRGKAKAERTDKVSRQWQEERCPSQHQMLALADCFAKAQTVQDRYWSSVIALLMFAPSRGGELSALTVDSLHEEDGRLGVRWYAEKGFGHTVKWVPEAMEETVREAFNRLIEIGQPARDAARFAHDYPGVFYRHAGCITPADFPEDRPLNALQFACTMGFAASTIELVKETCTNYDGARAWYCLNPANRTKWITKLRVHGNPSYKDLARYTIEQFGSKEWPNLPRTARPIWEALLLIREKETHPVHAATQFSWLMPTLNQLNDQLAPRAGSKTKIKTIFQRFGFVDEDGADIELTSHQIRVWLSTNAERGGMDAWKLAQWAGRARTQDNRHYDLRTERERDEQVRAVLALEGRPTALEAVRLNLPVPYTALGLNRVGIADPTLYGMCTHDYAMSPCTKAGDCMVCKEHVCLKGMPKTLDRIKRLEEQLASQLEKANLDASEGIYGASRWEQYFKWKLAHVRTQRIWLESGETPEGAVLWMPAEHDPSPVKRALEQQGHPAKAAEDELVGSAIISGLLGMDDA